MDYQQYAKEQVAKVFNEAYRSNLPPADPNDFYVVWFCKTLQNWKCLISTDQLQGHYYEVTHNGDASETYIDTYVKAANVAIPTVFPSTHVPDVENPQLITSAEDYPWMHQS